jgi:AcrR family transcriptional regulator
MATESTSTKRRYEKRARAAQEEATRQRITEAAVELHSTVGPSRTTIAAIADRAGVRRATVYRHFPDERALLQACSGHVAATNPPPDPAVWSHVADPEARLRVALDALYDFYERSEQLLANIVRDVEKMPAVREAATRRVEYLQAVEAGLARGWGARGRRAATLRAALGLALDFRAWQRLRAGGLSNREAAETMARAILCQ